VRHLALAPGAHTVEVEAEGMPTRTLEVDLAAGQHRSETIEPRQATNDDIVPLEPPARGGGIGGVGVAGLAIAGAGAAGLVVSLITGLVSDATYQSLQTQCEQTGPDSYSCPLDRAGDIDSGRAMAWTSTITLIVGGVFVAGGVTLFAIDLASGGGGMSERARLRITPGPTPIGLGAHLTF
jgi:hypothetical protein